MNSEFDEIRAILKEVAQNQKKTDAQLAKTDAAIDRLTLSQEKTDVAIDRLILSQEKTDAQLAKTDAQLAKTDAQLEKTIKKLDAIGIQLGDLGHSNGEHAESFFYDSLAEKKTMGGVKYDVISKNYKRRRNRTEDEYDIFLENGTSIGVIEVKYKVQKAHIEKLITKKAANFRELFPEYKNYSLYMGIAGLSFEADTENFASASGLAVLKQKGDFLEVNSSQMRAF